MYSDFWEKLFFSLKFVVISAVVLIYLSFPAYGFYEFQGEESSLDLRGFVRFFGAFNANPDNRAFYENSTDFSGVGIGRLLLDSRLSEQMALELNGYQFFNTLTGAAVAPDSQGTSPGDVERSSALEWKQQDRSKSSASFAVDRLSLKIMSEEIDITLGRQPVNFATTFYFTPNDFFGPFTAQTFYRVYKPGVDAARADVLLGELSQISITGVFGYGPDSSSSNGWSNSPALDRSSFLTRVVSTRSNFEWALLGGKVANKNIIGASLQGDMFDWLGIRGEGHYAIPEDNSDNDFEFSIGIEHRFQNDITLQGEFFHHGTGSDSVGDYEEGNVTIEAALPYLARWYTAVGIGYQATPLLVIDGVAVTNLIDGSNLFSFNAVYSLSNEAELSFALAVPTGRRTKNNSKTIQSEFGLYPSSANIEVRMFF